MGMGGQQQVQVHVQVQVQKKEQRVIIPLSTFATPGTMVVMGAMSPCLSDGTGSCWVASPRCCRWSTQ